MIAGLSGIGLGFYLEDLLNKYAKLVIAEALDGANITAEKEHIKNQILSVMMKQFQRYKD